MTQDQLNMDVWYPSVSFKYKRLSSEEVSITTYLATSSTSVPTAVPKTVLSTTEFLSISINIIIRNHVQVRRYFPDRTRPVQQKHRYIIFSHSSVLCFSFCSLFPWIFQYTKKFSVTGINICSRSHNKLCIKMLT